MSKKGLMRHSPEEKQANELWALLDAKSGGEVIEKVRGLQALVKEMAANGPLTLTLAIQRVTGRLTFTTSIAAQTQEQDVRLLLEAMRTIEKQLNEALLKLAEERGKSSAAGQPAQEGDEAARHPRLS